MSLKAKLEAVIYAAEEPVTLAQLAVLFADDAFEFKAQQAAASAEEAAQTDFAASQAQPMLVEQFAYLETNAEGLSVPSAEPEAEADAVPDAVPDSAAGVPSNEELSAEPEAGAEAQDKASSESKSGSDAEAELETRRLARQRDREARAILRQLLDELIDEYLSDERGVEIREIAGGYRMATKPECHDAVRLFVKSLKPALRLSLPALETLAVVAYKQPVTAPEVNEIRGVDSSGVFGSLLARKLITTAGRKPVIGRPILYKTTREFLLRFGLRDLSELPSMEEFEKLAAIELEEPDSEAGEDSEQKRNPALGPEFDEAASEELEDSPADELQAQPQIPEPSETAETAACNESSTLVEDAPAAPPLTEQEETENLPNDNAKDEDSR